MSKIEKLYDRSGGKWAHPELDGAYQSGEGVPGPSATYLNTDKSFEERKEMCQQLVDASMPLFPHIDCETFQAKGCEEEPDAPDVKMEVYYPENRRKKKMPCLYAIPGGGLCFCISSSMLNSTKKFADEFGCAVVTFTYRTIYNGGGYPQTINDCHAGYKWLIENAESLGVNPDKIVIFGTSSGSHLSMALCHRLKRYGWYGHKARGCVVLGSIADDRTCFPSSKFYIKGGWNSMDNETAARLWLGRIDYSHVPAEAFPNHASPEDCIGLPPTFIHTDEHDPCSDACTEYVSKLVQAGVYAELHRWGGSFHGLPFAPQAEDCDYVRRANSIFYGNLRDCFQYDLRREWIADLVDEGK